MPAYLQLCIETWEKFLPEFEINILDYQTVFNYLDKSTYNFDHLKNTFTFPVQADAIRCALLAKYGGIWFDTDTIILSSKFKELVDYTLSNYDFGMIEENPDKEIGPHIGLIISSLPPNRKTKFFDKWQAEIGKRVEKYGKSTWSFMDKHFLNRKMYQTARAWNFLGNSIVNDLLKDEHKREYFPIDNRKLKTVPETVIYPNMDRYAAYRKFYFFNKKSFEDYNLDSVCLYLHNSWTPKEYRGMSKSEFLSQDILLAKLLKRILND